MAVLDNSPIRSALLVRPKYEPVPASSGTSILHIAAQHGLLNVARTIVNRDPVNICPDRTDSLKRTPLHYACSSGDAPTVGLLLDKGASINVFDIHQCTPLHFATASGHDDVVRLLLDAGANIQCADLEHKTPLYHAVQSNRIDSVQRLLGKGADTACLGPHRHDLLTLAASSGHEEIAKLALALQDIRWPMKSFGIALVFASTLGLAGLIGCLLSSGKFASHEDPFVQQAFIAAVMGAWEDIMQLFLGFGCNPNVRDHHHVQTALSIGAAYGHPRIVLILLQHGANPNVEDIQTSKTPLIHAVTHGKPIIVSILIQRGASIMLPTRAKQKDTDGWVYKILAYLITQCPKDSKRRASDEPSDGSSKESVKGSSDNARISQPNLSVRHKRPRKQKSEDDPGEHSGDDRESNNRNCNEVRASVACPFQIMFPHQHMCRPKADVARIK